MFTKEEVLEMYRERKLVWEGQVQNLYALSSTLGLAKDATDDGNRFTEMCRGLYTVLDRTVAMYNDTLFHLERMVEILEKDGQEEATKEVQP